MFDDFVRFVREIYHTSESIPLHAPVFNGNENEYIAKAIDSTFVSSVGEFVNEFEHNVANFIGAHYAIATMNGTAALHISLLLSGVKPDTEVITQSFTFVATCNAIRYCGAVPIFVDVDLSTLGLSPDSLEVYLDETCEVREDGFCWNKMTNRQVVACLPMHTFGFPVQIDAIQKICDRYRISLIEDAAESLGSTYKEKHTGLVGKMSAISFNGNKIITAGGGGVILTNDEELAVHAKHITTTAKIAHSWDFMHDEVGFNYRLPNLNAALGVAQMEVLPDYLKNKRILAKRYQQWGKDYGIKFMQEPAQSKSNYWLNTVILPNKVERDAMLDFTNSNNVMTRPAWTPMHKLGMNSQYQKTEMKNTEWLFDRIVNVPSSVIIDK